MIAAEKMTPEVLREIGALALQTETVDEEQWVAPFEEQIAGRGWPEQKLLLSAIDVESGEFRMWDRGSGVDLARAGHACAFARVAYRS